MSAGDFMGLGLVVVMILVIVNVIAGAYKRRLAFKERALELTAARTSTESTAPYAAQVERLEQRMRVLERIATDKGTDLAAQIEDLREAVPVRGELQ
jgi:hypothetical protein